MNFKKNRDTACSPKLRTWCDHPPALKPLPLQGTFTFKLYSNFGLQTSNNLHNQLHVYCLKKWQNSPPLLLWTAFIPQYCRGNLYLLNNIQSSCSTTLPHALKFASFPIGKAFVSPKAFCYTQQFETIFSSPFFFFFRFQTYNQTHSLSSLINSKSLIWSNMLVPLASPRLSFLQWRSIWRKIFSACNLHSDPRRPKV